MKINKSISCIRILACEMINKAASGHPGIALGAAPMMYAIFKNHIKLNLKKVDWYNRDRFVLSAGHGSALLYSVLHLVGYKISIEDIKNFRQIDSITPGHPENFLTPGVEAITGPLGQGLGVLVGMALTESIKAARFNVDQYKIIDNYTFGITSDGDLQEGASYEAISLAGHWKLNKLIVLFDSNDIQLDSETKDVQSENIRKRFESANWNYILVKNGNDEKQINNAINKAKKSKDKPTLIEVKTVIGFGTTNKGTTLAHGTPIFDDIIKLKQSLQWEYDKNFYVPDYVKNDFKTIDEKGRNSYDKWNEMLKEYAKKYPEKYKVYKQEIENKFNINYKKLLDNAVTEAQATRVSSGIVMNYLSNKYKNLIGGSGDLSSSTKIKGADGPYQYNNKKGRNILYGVREFAMAAINNGIALYGGTVPFASGFFVFSDYMKPAIRLTSMMKLQALFIYTHDSILVGEDGSTHQPIEHLAMFRSQPNLNVIRPADFKEVVGSYMYALNNSPNTPTLLLMSRQNVPQLQETDINKVMKGAYLVYKSKESKTTLIATGSELHLAFKIKDELKKYSININIVSMPSQNLFDKQSVNYKNEIIPHEHKIISLEFSSTYGWAKYTGRSGLNIGVDHFGYSGKQEDILKKLKFDTKSLTNRIIDFLNKK